MKRLNTCTLKLYGSLPYISLRGMIITLYSALRSFKQFKNALSLCSD